MKITELHIDGFGLFHDLKIDGLSPELSLILGDNESGKSTLMGFIRAILFGFPDGRSNDNPYPPLTGGRHGGSLKLMVDNQGSHVVERYPGVRGGKVEILKSDHSMVDKDHLNGLLGIGNRNLFKQVFAFSLTELQDFETLNTEAVKEVLYSAGAGIDPKGLMDLRSSLDRREADLFKPGGKKPVINRALTRLMAISKEKRALRSSVEEFDHLQSDIERTKEEIESFEGRKANLAIELRKNEQWLNILPEWLNLSISRDKLNELEPIQTFPPDGITRLNSMRTRSEDLGNDLTLKEDQVIQQKNELDRLRVDEIILKNAPSIKKLRKDQGRFEVIIQDLISAEQDLKVYESRMKHDLIQLGPAWTEEKVLDFDTSVSMREEIRAFQDILAHNRLETQKKKNSLDELKSNHRDMNARFEDSSIPIPHDREILDQMLVSSREIRKLKSEEAILLQKIEDCRERLNDSQEEKLSLQDVQKPDKRTLSKRPIILGIIAWVCIFIMTGLFGNWKLAIILSAILAILGVVLFAGWRNIRKKERERDGIEERRYHRLLEKTGEFEKRLSESEADLTHVRNRIASATSVLADYKTGAERSTELIEEDILKDISQLEKRDQIKKELTRIEQRLIEARRDSETQEKEENKKINEWQKWLSDRGFEPSLSPEGALETLSLIMSTKEQVEQLNQIRSRKTLLHEEKSRYLDLANKVISDCYGKIAEENAVPVMIESLVNSLSEAESTQQKKELLVKDIETSEVAVARLKRLIEDIEQKIRDLIAEGGASSEKEFIEHGRISEQQDILKKDIERYSDNIKRLSSRLEDPEKIMEELPSITQEELEEQRIKMEKEMKDVESGLDGLKRDHAKLEERIRLLINDDRISDLRIEEERIKEELLALTDEWVTIRLTRGLIRMAKSRFEKERQPKVISEAGRFFNMMTLGRYTSLLSPIGEDRIDVIYGDRTVKGIEQLSRGTAEQLYLALRFGFIREFSKRSVPLPVIMDEILVNFDPHRARATIKGIAELSKINQVIFFTCHPFIADMFREEISGVPVIELADGKIKGNN